MFLDIDDRIGGKKNPYVVRKVSLIQMTAYYSWEFGQLNQWNRSLNSRITIFTLFCAMSLAEYNTSFFFKWLKEYSLESGLKWNLRSSCFSFKKVSTFSNKLWNTLYLETTAFIWYVPSLFFFLSLLLNSKEITWSTLIFMLITC